MTPAIVRDQGTSVLSTWLAKRESELADALNEQTASADVHVAAGLAKCADAARQGLVDTLIVRERDPGVRSAPGRTCDGCGWLRVRPNIETCPRCQEATRWVADPVEEVAVRVLDLRGRVELIANSAPAGHGGTGSGEAGRGEEGIWARLRSPLPA